MFISVHKAHNDEHNFSQSTETKNEYLKCVQAAKAQTLMTNQKNNKTSVAELSNIPVHIIQGHRNSNNPVRVKH